MTTLYNLRTDGDQYRITKFTDGEVESSYLCSETLCECPAGTRPTCRHRRMLPEMLTRDICNTHWFYDFDIARVVDLNGQLKSNLDALTQPHSTTVSAPDFDSEDGGSNPPAVAKPAPGWRRI